MEKWTRISYVNNAVTAEEQAAREHLHAAMEKAMETYMNESRMQDIVGVEMFPCEEEERAA